MKKQLGYIDIPSGTFETLGVLAGIGLLSLLGCAGYGLYWLVTHVRVV